jgi:flagellar P-ring protein precursor FlgI
MLTLILVAVGMEIEAYARVRLENICEIHGQQELRLTGLGLVYGLNGTGDGGKMAPTIRALSAAMDHFNNPIADPRELKDANNVAVVLIEATVPRNMLQRGQKIDCHVGSNLGAKSLRGGKLLVCPLQSVDQRDTRMIATASGSIIMEDPTMPTQGRIPNGVVMEIDMIKDSSYVNQIVRVENNVKKISLLLDESHSSYMASNEVARVLNDEFSFQSNGEKIAKAVSPGVIDVVIPSYYSDDPVGFVSDVLQVWIDTPHSQAKVIVNTKTKVVIVTSEVEISPALITHPNLEVAIQPGIQTQNAATGRFVDLRESQQNQSTARLDQLVAALKQLRVPPDGIIEVLRELSKTGKLHAIYEEN